MVDDGWLWDRYDMKNLNHSSILLLPSLPPPISWSSHLSSSHKIEESNFVYIVFSNEFIWSSSEIVDDDGRWDGRLWDGRLWDRHILITKKITYHLPSHNLPSSIGDVMFSISSHRTAYDLKS